MVCCLVILLVPSSEVKPLASKKYSHVQAFSQMLTPPLVLLDAGFKLDSIVATLLQREHLKAAGRYPVCCIIDYIKYSLRVDGWHIRGEERDVAIHLFHGDRHRHIFKPTGRHHCRPQGVRPVTANFQAPTQNNLHMPNAKQVTDEFFTAFASREMQQYFENFVVGF